MDKNVYSFFSSWFWEVIRVTACVTKYLLTVMVSFGSKSHFVTLCLSKDSEQFAFTFM